MKIIKPPQRVDLKAIKGKKVFLASSINQGKTEPWADKLAKHFDDTNTCFFNPLRDNWDADMEQTINNPQFSEQVNWELDHLLKSDITVFFIDKEGESPISIGEVYLMSLLNASGKCKVIVCCEKGFWRRGNIEIMCYRFKMPLVETIEELIDKLSEEL